MARKPYDTFADLRKAGQKRRVDGRVLIQHGKLRGGMYLLGYAVECALKSYIMSRLQVRILEDAERAFAARFGEATDLTTGHDLERLYASAERLGLEIGNDTALLKARSEALRWKVDWRYAHRKVTGGAVTARYFERSVCEFYDWVTSRV